MREPVAPLNPDPYSTKFARRVPESVKLFATVFGLGRQKKGSSVSLMRSSIETVAFIPPKTLKGKFKVFRDDRISTQPNRLSKALRYQRFKVVHGLRVSAVRLGNSLLVPPDPLLFARSRPTKFRVPASPPFKAPIHYSPTLPFTTPPHGSRALILAAGTHVRAQNGFLKTWVGEQLAKLDGYEPDEIPQIGSSIQLWFAEDNCKCIAVAHNFFPKYDIFLEGVRIGTSLKMNFDEFDKYQIPNAWRPFIAMQLINLLQELPVAQRHPALCLVGWYQEVSSDGKVLWCEDTAPPILIEFDQDTPSYEEVPLSAYVDRYVSRYLRIRNRLAPDETHDSRVSEIAGADEDLRNSWGGIIAKARVKTFSSSA